MIIQELPKLEPVPKEAALEGKCKQCNIKIIVSVTEITVDPIVSVLDNYYWPIECPKCKDSLLLHELLAEEIEYEA